MHNWSSDLRALRSRSHAAFELFILEQKINFGLGRSRLARQKLLRYWQKLRIDPLRKKFLAFLLWPKR